MKDIFKKYKKRILTLIATLALAAAIIGSGGSVDWGKLLSDVSSGEVTDTAQKLEDLKPTEIPVEPVQ